MPMPLPQPIVPDYQEVINNALAQKQRDLFSNAGDLYANGDRTGAINALLRGGEFGQANNLTNMNVADQNRALAKSAGGLAASGNLAGARNAYFAGGDLDSARTMQNFMNSASDRDLAAANRSHAVTSNLALAADTPEKWDTALGTADAMGLNTSKYRQINQQYGWEAARNAALADHEQMGTLLQNAQTQRDQSNKVVGQAAIQADEESWPQTLAALKANGYNTQGLDGEAGRQLAIARAGLGQTVFSADAKAQATANKATSDANRLQQEFEASNPGKKLPFSLALSAATALSSKFNSGQVLKGWEFDDNGNPVKPIWDTPAGTVADLKRQQLGVAQQRVDPNQVYNRSLATNAAKFDAQNAAREAQAVIVDRHTNLAADVAGGWELDNSKLTPEQLAQRRNFEASIGGIRGNIPKTWQTIKGEIAPDSETPAVVRELSAINQMMKAEVTRLATVGQGAVAEGVRNEFDNVVGNFLTNPSTKTYLQTLAFTKKMMGEFKDVPNTGYDQLQRMQGKPVTPRQGIPATPQVGELQKGYRFKGGNPADPNSWEKAQ